MKLEKGQWVTVTRNKFTIIEDGIMEVVSEHRPVYRRSASEIAYGWGSPSEDDAPMLLSPPTTCYFQRDDALTTDYCTFEGHEGRWVRA